MQAIEDLINLPPGREPVARLLPHPGKIPHRLHGASLQEPHLILTDPQTQGDIEGRSPLRHHRIRIERIHLRMLGRERDSLDNPLRTTRRNPVELDVKTLQVIKKDRRDLESRHRRRDNTTHRIGHQRSIQTIE
ncbi:hypothetical protein [Microbacterium sp.]|uniref:hypothetical protein n=1 Tax=Microbacterium sp. TaxID=51671 RepID=UPI0039E5F037